MILEVYTTGKFDGLICLTAVTMIVGYCYDDDYCREKEGSLLLSKLFSALTMIVLRCRYSGRFDRFSLLLLQIDGKLFGYSNKFEGRFRRCVEMPQMKFGYFAADEFC